MKLLHTQNSDFKAEANQQQIQGLYFLGKDFVDVHVNGKSYRLPLAQNKTRKGISSAQEGNLSAPMPGKILKVLVQEGASVKAGETLLILEAMKMEHKISSPKDGILKKIYYKENERVNAGASLCEVL